MIEKQTLLAEMDQGFRDWQDAISAVPQDRLAELGVSGEWAVKDIIAHVAWYEWWTAEFIRTRTWPVLASNLDFQETDARNNAYFAARQNDPAEVILEEATRWHGELVAAVSGATDAEYADTSLIGMPQGREWRFDNIVAEATFRHYPEHVAAIRAWLDVTPRP